MALDHEQPATPDDLAAAFLHGDGRSRWFDKTLQFLITPRGEGAINMEHSVTDGSIMSTLGAYLTSQEECPREYLEEGVPPSCQEMAPALSGEIRKLLREAADAYDELCSKTTLRTLVFDDFGKEVIKSLKVSPDGFVQMGFAARPIPNLREFLQQLRTRDDPGFSAWPHRGDPHRISSILPICDPHGRRDCS